MPGKARRWGAAVAVVVLLGISGCGDGFVDPTPTEACPEPTRSDAGERPGAVGVTVSGTYAGDLPRGSDGSLVVALDDGRGSPATSVTACQQVELRIELRGASPSSAVTVAPGPFAVTSTDGEGRLALVDQQTLIDAYDAAGWTAGSWGQLTGWYVTVNDPAPGTYVVEHDVTWSQHLGEREGERRATGTVAVVLVLG